MNKLFVLLFAALSLASCKNLVPYTDAMRQQYNWSDAELQRIQFYVSRSIILRRELSHGTMDIVHGKIKTIAGKQVDEIIIPQGTPGVVTQIPRENKLMVSFELGDNHSLSFGVNPHADGKYMLLASGWDRGVGQIHYNGEEYNSDPDSKYAFLNVDFRKIQKMETRQRVAKGRKIK